MADNKVGYSRAGDTFHYRWAARRALKLIYPNSDLCLLVVEGSKDDLKAGEYVIDVSEYYGDQDTPSKIIYYQLKHTTTQKDKPFILSDLKDTFVGFGEKYIERKKKNEIKSKGIQFSIVTNRPFEKDFKQNLTDIATGTCTDKKFINTISRYTNLKGIELASFCSILKVEDAEADYNLQKQELRVEVARIVAGTVDNAQLSSLTTLMSERALPNSDGTVLKENVLQCFGYQSESELYPAKPIWDPSGPIVDRIIYRELSTYILTASQPIIVHAPGGVGKSVFTRYLIDNIAEGSEVIAYDCFGAGSYRNRSKSRHRHRDALVEIANELAAKGLCDPLLIQNGTHEAEMIRSFIKRIESALDAIKTAYKDGILLLLIDAADNAEMAAKEMNDICFAAELLREKLPEGCKLAYLCRPERMELLKPQSYVAKFSLTPFSNEETLQNLRLYYSDATAADAEEFHRLTSANPRVQANALATGAAEIATLLADLGPSVITVEAQIQQQLERALGRLKDNLPAEYHRYLDNICIGLASLSPNIPLDILAKVAGVEISAVKSFVTDIGRSLWLSDDSVQFRDEPSETWFRQKFIAEKRDLEKFILELEPLANQSSYAAQVLPQLYLQAEQYEKLIQIALSDDYLPADSPIDQRNIRVYRLQFALKAALKVNQIKDACKLALRAGEETAGNQRQAGLLRNNVDLLVRLQSKDQIQQIAMRRELGGNWEGSENVYSASLLSQISEFKGEARSFLRSAENWLSIYFKTPKDTTAHEEPLRLEDLMELAYAHLNLNGVDASMGFLLKLKPKPAVAKIFGALIKLLIDSAQFELIGKLLQKCKKERLFVLAANNELARVGRFCQKVDVESLLNTLSKKPIKSDNNTDDVHDKPDMSIVMLAEAAIHYDLDAEQTIKLVNAHLPSKATRTVTQSYYRNLTTYYLRSLALRQYLGGNPEISIEAFLPEKFSGKKLSYDEERELSDYKEILGALIPWYVGRLEIIKNGGAIDPQRIEQLAELSKKAGRRYRSEDPIPEHLSIAFLEILKHAASTSESIIKTFFDCRLKGNKQVLTRTWIATVRWAHRLEHMISLRDELESYAYDQIRADTEGSPDDLAFDYITLARAVLITSVDNASVYFNNAVEIVSKFGDEMIHRWEATTSLADRASTLNKDQDELSYRFIRIAELVGRDIREKHWSRGEAIQLAIGLSPAGGIAALSRWRDRYIGRFAWLINSMLNKLVESGRINSLLAWSFTPFCSTESLPYLVKAFLKSGIIPVREKNIILEGAVKRLRCELTTDSYWYELLELLQEYGLQSAGLEEILLQLPERPNKESATTSDKEYTPDLDWDEIFNGHELLTPDGITTINEIIKKAATEKQFHMGRHILFKEALERLKDGDLVKFIDALLQCDWLEHYDVASFFEHLPAARSARPAFTNKLQAIIEMVGFHFPLELTNQYGFDLMIKALPGSEEKSVWLKKGMFKGMINNQEFASAENLFDLVRLAAPDLSAPDAAEALTYSLDRFEIHLDNDFGDGPWLPWLKTTGNAVDGLAGFLWSALASPSSDTRWRAAHTIKELAGQAETSVIEALFHYTELSGIGAYGCKSYPFYTLHALQYLMIACARISLEQPVFLKSHAKRIVGFALKYDHLIIQQFAADAAIRIGNASPDIFTSAETEALKLVGKSPFPVELEKEDGFSQADHHENEDDETAYGYDFGYDFSRYWLGGLGDEFGLSQKEIVKRTASVIVNEWKLKAERYDDDPRVELWNRHRDDYRTSFSHGSYPHDHNYRFYLSYHAMMVAGAGLLKELPVVADDDLEAQNWGKWLSYHLLTRPDGYWLADWKDPLPLKRPAWPGQDFKSWQADIKASNMVADLIMKKNKKIWLTVTGGWEEELDSRRETYSVRSALVSPGTADALMRALATCVDPHDFKLPDYRERNMEIAEPPFELKGWIVERNVSAELDEYDPFAEELPFSVLKVGKDIIQDLNISAVKSGKEYVKNQDNGEVVIFSEQWSSTKDDKDQEPQQRGSRTNCSLDFLQELCDSQGMEIIIKVLVDRNMSYRYRSGRDKDRQDPVHKIFILSANGELRDSERSYRIRETVSEGAGTGK
ncbi:hypothetical protein [Mucilaginibacter sp. OK098]|uniref:hypothetical protein n=1 Tax=Mucilaginibacter sp. OK098 TaxID=1855297 RepID=UPI00091AC603|nr:hypothetical protein [Mucilaginibacter sp. OK098]SHM92302.1 hypothetical protein SAMN05216524_104127 [Mucilaginibacter sp. OK098]